MLIIKPIVLLSAFLDISEDRCMHMRGKLPLTFLYPRRFPWLWPGKSALETRLLITFTNNSSGITYKRVRLNMYFVRSCLSPLAMHIEEHLEDLNLTLHM